MTESLLFLGALALGLWFWFDSLRSREIAIGLGKAACQRRGVQFLDQTVAQSGLKLASSPQGLRIQRRFRFDYSEEGMSRRSGQITMLGTQVTQVLVETDTGVEVLMGS